MVDDGLSLDELSELSGVEPRTLRSWVSEGLLAPPFKPGRGARYPSSNANRALAVCALKDLHGLSLSEIGRQFMMSSEDQIREWAGEAAPTLTSSESARAYLKRIQPGGVGSKSMHRTSQSAPSSIQRSAFPQSIRERNVSKPTTQSNQMPHQERRQAELAVIERLILELEHVLKEPAPRRSRGALWTRIAITSDLELSVRGNLSARERVLFEQLADHFRAILTGRAWND
ncbi:helix-turn-helix domain-containing protein [Qipengyuania gaetbuli]|uniref:MerR family transcriptional regulator n=1 Tax=Qipengyuania gaetbuli TaxID=266952 RepID=UPI001C9912B2|nr:helix-turn-helix domain-containing protein [Qipengyuania gaetbuli]